MILLDVQDVKKHNATDVVRVGGATYTTNLLQNEGIHVMVFIIINVANYPKHVCRKAVEWLIGMLN